MSEEPALALVTGASGFIGSHLTEALLKRGYRVRCLLRRTSDPTFIADLPVERAYVDLRSADGLREACQGVDIVCHCAALTRALDEETFMHVNARGTQMLAETCMDVNPHLRRFLYVSSFAAAGPSHGLDDVVDESRTPQPITWYGRSKWAAEQALQAMASSPSRNGDDGGLPLTIVRPAAVYGPRDRDTFVYFELVKWGLSLRLGRRERRVTLIYVRDLVALILLALETDAAVGQTYCAGDQMITYAEISDLIARVMNKRPLRLTLPDAVLTPIGLWAKVEARLTGRPALLNEQRLLDLGELYWLCTSEKARQELGFVPQYDLETSVRETVDWYRESGWL